MGFFMAVMSATLLFLCYFSVKAYNRILELESSRINRIFWLCFIIVQMIFILICFNDDWLMSLLKFILNPTDTLLPILIISGFVSFICLIIMSLLILLKNIKDDFKFIKLLFLVVWFMSVHHRFQELGRMSWVSYILFQSFGFIKCIKYSVVNKY